MSLGPLWHRWVIFSVSRTCGHAFTGQYLQWTTSHPTAQCWWYERPNTTKTRFTSSRTARHGKNGRRRYGLQSGSNQGGVGIGPYFADERCSQAVLDFLATTDVGRTVPPAAVEDEAPQLARLPEE